MIPFLHPLEVVGTSCSNNRSSKHRILGRILEATAVDAAEGEEVVAAALLGAMAMQGMNLEAEILSRRHGLPR